jgi:hypothetical protein
MDGGEIHNNSILLQNQVVHVAAGLSEPHWFDAAYPIFAFVAVMVVPSCIALWVIYKTLREKECAEGER